ncbi:hypothetical protein ABG067_001558 [Albugo candida]|uniref:Uncharacterized protein n=1 Tax=Albugo candida TaxID=65357 RepID=A0A024GPZ4_9STRA|nr:unnamed protein product [Albugo candida]|eukprot:CCI48404.1 unnamed protein product [Albugo candida]
MTFSTIGQANTKLYVPCLLSHCGNSISSHLSLLIRGYTVQVGCPRMYMPCQCISRSFKPKMLVVIASEYQCISTRIFDRLLITQLIDITESSGESSPCHFQFYSAIHPGVHFIQREDDNGEKLLMMHDMRYSNPNIVIS